MPDQELDRLLGYDSLAEAEKATGQSYKTSDATGFIGLALAFYNNEKLHAKLDARRDTHFGVKYPWFLKRLAEEGFEEVAKYPAGDIDTLYLHVKRDEGLVIRWETYRDGINSGDVLFNLEFNDCEKSTYISKTSGGLARGTDRRIYVGLFDIREALFYTLDGMRAKGKFIAPWIEAPYNKILSYVDWKMPKQEDRDALHEQRMSDLPKWLKDLMWNNTDA